MVGEVALRRPQAGKGVSHTQSWLRVTARTNVGEWLEPRVSEGEREEVTRWSSDGEGPSWSSPGGWKLGRLWAMVRPDLDVLVGSHAREVK